MTDCICPSHIGVDKDGYPRAKHQGRMWRMNRLIWTFSYGPIEKGAVVGHTCNNTGCININHLYLTSFQQNSTDAARDGLYLTGDKHPKTKYTSAIAEEMHRLYHQEWYTQQQIADKFNTTQSRVSEVIRRYIKTKERDNR